MPEAGPSGKDASSALPAEEDTEEELLTASDLEYKISGGKATVTRYTGSGGAVTIPAKLGGAAVTAIGEDVKKAMALIKWCRAYVQGNLEEVEKTMKEE